MKIVLKNFRCYENSTFDFGEKGLTLLSGSSGAGKCLAKNTKILLYSGDVVNVEDIKIGDKLMGDDSTARTVLSLCNGIDEMYKIIPMKGRSYTVNSKHILTLKGVSPKCDFIKGRWTVRYMKNSKQQYKYFKEQKSAIEFYKTLAHNPINDICIEDYLRLSKKDKMLNYTFSVATEFDEKLVPIDPYTLGFWLGKGDRNIISDIYPKIHSELFQTLKVYPNNITETDSFYDIKLPDNFITELKLLNLYDNKHIPYIYKTNSKALRNKLLDGLIDSNGYIEHNTIILICCTKELAEDIEYLGLSLGFMTVIKNIKENLYKVSIFFDSKFTRNKFKVKSLGTGVYYGFELDGNGRFLLGDFKVTHNSSILLGIYFALFGTGSKLTMYDKSSCSVSLEFDGMKITRSKKPNKLILECGEYYEDDAAQSIINKKFGETFHTTGYIAQNAINSFIMMSPLEKLGFLEKFAFQDTDISQIKKKCKDVINERNEVLLKSTSQLEIASAMIKELNKPEFMEFPLKHNSKTIPLKLREKAIKNTTVKHKNTETLISKNNKKIKSLQEESQTIQLLELKINSKQDTINSIDSRLLSLKTEIKEYGEISDDLLNQYEEQLSYMTLEKELASLQSRYEEDNLKLDIMKSDEKENVNKRIEILKSGLWVEYSKEDASDILSENKQLLKDLEKIKELETHLTSFKTDKNDISAIEDELESFKKELELKIKLKDKLELQKSIFQCPSCNKNLKLKDEKLQLVDNIEILSCEDSAECLETILKLKKKISVLENNLTSKKNKLSRYLETQKEIAKITEQYVDEKDNTLPEYEEIKKETEYMKNYISIQQNIERELNTLIYSEKMIENGKFSQSLETFNSSIKTQKRKIDSISERLSNLTPPQEDEEFIRNKISIQKQHKLKIKSLTSTIKNLSDEKSECLTQMFSYINFHTDKYKEIRKIDIVKTEIQTLENDLQELYKQKEHLENDIQNINKYQEYDKKLESYNVWIDKLNVLQKEEQEARKQYGAATMLREKILEAESISMANVISSINTHSQVYLDVFFPDHPISVKLVSFKETKGKNTTKKPQINLQIEYKSMETELASLSGGEVSRIILAFTLALGEMFNTPLMLLDECTASLDQELTSEVMEGIKANFRDKLVIIIAHQNIKGGYDKVIEI